ncbi:MAG: hypothetical protein KTR31_22055 [Myxococcales bacterium]|nr:hypothetical protein [Myxococcales bacterium]
MLRDDFVGRTAELACLQQALADGRRLMTITGIGGSGKTRLARQLVSCIELPWAFVAVEQARDPSDVMTALGREIAACRGVAAIEDIGVVLERGAVGLVVLDAFEGLADRAHAILGPWLAAAPSIHFLVTSRVPLGLAGEQVVLLSPLSLEDGMSLLVSRTRALQFDFDPYADRERLERVVERLDGNPLAIELAARRLQLLTVPALLDRLDDRFHLLRRPAHGQSDRHASLHAILDWSWQQLDAEERSVLAQCTIFRPDFTPDAAEAVVELGGAAGVLDVVQQLLARGLLVRRAGRLRMLDAVRDHARQQLEERHWRPLRERHAAHYAAKVQDIASSLGFELAISGKPDLALSPEIDNLTQIVGEAWGSAKQRVDVAVALTVLLDQLGPPSRVQASIDWAEGALSDSDGYQRARLMRARAHSAARLGQRDSRSDDCRAGSAAALSEGDMRLAASLTYAEFRRAVEAGDEDASRMLWRRVVDLHDAQDELPGDLLQGPAALALRFGTAEDALETCRAVMEATDRAELYRTHTMWLDNFAVRLFDVGRTEEASRFSDLAIQRAQAISDHAKLVRSFVNRIEYRVAVDDLPGAHDALEQLADLVHRTRVRNPPLGGLARARALLALVEDRLADAEAALASSGVSSASSIPTVSQAVARSLRAQVALLRGAASEPVWLLTESCETLQRHAMPRRSIALSLALRAVAHARLSDEVAAQRDLAQASTPIRAWNGARHVLTLSLLQHVVSVQLQQPGAVEAGSRALTRFFSGEDGQVPYIEARVAARLLSDCLQTGHVDRIVLRVGPELHWVQLGHESPMDLRRRPVPRRLLAALLRASEEAPGRGIPTQDLIEHVWPGDKAMRSALENRLWATLSKLRREGFEPVLKRMEGGYRIADAVCVLRVPAWEPR